MLLLLWACVVSVVLISGFGDGDLVMVSQNGKYLPRESEVLNSEHRYDVGALEALIRQNDYLKGFFAPFAWPPDIGRLILDQGYPQEQHWVSTEDGYMLQLFRIARYRTKTEAPPVVMLVSGLLDSAAAWVSNSPHQSLAFLLYDAGYDVWLCNVRGTTWGIQHSTADVNDPLFWQFTWDDMATYDLPAMCDANMLFSSITHILKATSAEKLSYVAHSQGTTIALAAMSKSLPVTKYISGAVLLAPVAFVSGTQSQTLSTLAALDVPAIIRRFGVRSFLPCTAGSSLVFSQICTYLPSFCQAFLRDLVGPSQSLNSTRIPLYLNFLPAGFCLALSFKFVRGTSVMNMEHWAQGVRRRGKPRMLAMDFGTDCVRGPWKGLCNQERYKLIQPPEYELHNVHVPLALLSGDQDVLAPPGDVSLLKAALPHNSIVFAREYEHYSHLDFTWGMNAHKDVYKDVLHMLANFTAAAQHTA